MTQPPGTGVGTSAGWRWKIKNVQRCRGQGLCPGEHPELEACGRRCPGQGTAVEKRHRPGEQHLRAGMRSIWSSSLVASDFAPKQRLVPRPGCVARPWDFWAPSPAALLHEALPALRPLPPVPCGPVKSFYMGEKNYKKKKRRSRHLKGEAEQTPVMYSQA